jgi:hypothetical protein
VRRQRRPKKRSAQTSAYSRTETTEYVYGVSGRKALG